MSAILLGVAYVLSAALGITTVARAVEGRQLNTANRACGCVCRPIDGTIPWVFEDLAILLTNGERIAKKYPWFTGTIVCLRPEEADVEGRFQALQAAVDEGERTRLCALTQACR